MPNDTPPLSKNASAHASGSEAWSPLRCRILPNGIHGIEERLHVMWETLVNTGLITPSHFVRLSSTEAAKIFNLYPQKGLIAPGSDGDIAILDPTKEHVLSAKTHHSALDTSVYEGMNIKGKVSAWRLVLLHACHCGHYKCSISSVRQSFLRPYCCQ